MESLKWGRAFTTRKSSPCLTPFFCIEVDLWEQAEQDSSQILTWWEVHFSNIVSISNRGTRRGWQTHWRMKAECLKVLLKKTFKEFRWFNLKRYFMTIRYSNTAV